MVRIAAKNPDVISLVEIKPKNGDVPCRDALLIDGYELFLNKHYDDADTRGTCLYIKSDLNASAVHNSATDTFKDSLWVNIKDRNSRNLLIGTIYRSGSPEKATSLDKALHSMIRTMSTDHNYHEVVIMGDFNHKDITWCDESNNITTTNPIDANFVECLDDSYLHQMVQENTRYPTQENQKPSLLDLVLTNDQSLISEIEYDPHIGGSDHIALNFSIITSLSPEEEVHNTQVKYQYYKADIDKMNQLFDINWEEALHGLAIEDAYTLFVDKYKDVVNKCVPQFKNKEDSFRVNKLPNKPVWMKASTEKLVKDKQHTWVKFLNTKSPQHYELYRQARNKVSHAVNYDRWHYEKGIAREIRDNLKAFWKYVNKSRKNKRQIPNLIRKNGTLTKTDCEKANALNEQFCSVYTSEDLDNIPDFPERKIRRPLAEIIITPEVILKKLKDLKVDKSCGPDEVHPFIMKNCAQILVKPLTIIFQTSLQQGTLPSIWKHGRISPLFKKGKRNIPANYRPVTLTSIICKILESIIVDSIIDHITFNSLQDKNQHGFTKFRSTITNLLQAMNIWTDALSHGFPVDIVYFDYEKAFDKVPHQRLLRQLQSLGITSKPLKWIQDFLRSRTQCVSVNGMSSDISNVTSGVPQGSVLGPILFLLYVCDATKQVNNFLSLFADDTKLYSILLDLGHSHEQLQDDVDSLCRWSEKMLMSYNIDKCHTLHLGKRNPLQTYTLSKSDLLPEESSFAQLHYMKNVNSEKDLGVIIDDKLSFNQHIESKLLKAKQLLGVVRSTFKYMDEDIFLRLYKSIIRPHLEYADIVWSPTTKQYQDKIEKFQRRATRIVPSLSNLSYKERLQKLNLPTLKYRRMRSSLLFLYKYTHGLVNADFNTNCSICPNTNALQPSLSTHTRGNSLKFQIQHHPGMRQKFFTTHALPVWNRLNEKTVTATSINSFKNKLSTDAAMISQFDYQFSF